LSKSCDAILAERLAGEIDCYLSKQFTPRKRDMPANHTEVEKRLWEAADELRANSKLKSSEYSVPVLGLIFLRYADQKFSEAEKKLSAAGSGRRKVGKTDYQAQGVLRRVSMSLRPVVMEFSEYFHLS